MDALQGLKIWDRACRLAADALRATADCSDRAFRDQLTQSSLAIPSRIAAGYERQSRPHYAEFLREARSACAAMRTQLYIGAEVGLLESVQAHQLISDVLQISKTLAALIEHCELRQ